MKQAKNDNNSTYSKTHKKVFVMELPEAAKSIYQLSNANKPQNREIVLFSLMLQELT